MTPSLHSHTDECPAKRHSVGRLVRVSPALLETGLVCGISKPWIDGGAPCGGRIVVEDWHPKGVRGWLRYEAYCTKCGTCDCNGWARQDEILPGAIDHFDATEDPANKPTDQ